VDRNFAVHLPVLDRLFGTQHLPRDAWPDRYGLADDAMPEGWWRQLLQPIRA
jgi:lathosterol oxidase